jgi:hypothetical protein
MHQVSNLTVRELLEWFYDQAIGRLVAECSEIRESERRGEPPFPPTAQSRRELLEQLNIPDSPRYDLLQLCLDWLAVTAGGPRYLHLVRIFQINCLDTFCAVNNVPWPALNPNKLVLLRFARDEDAVGSHPRDPVSVPGLVAHPAVQGLLTFGPETISKAVLQEANSEKISNHALLSEFIRLYSLRGSKLGSQARRKQVFASQHFRAEACHRVRHHPSPAGILPPSYSGPPVQLGRPPEREGMRPG